MIAYTLPIARLCLAIVFLYSGVDKLWTSVTRRLSPVPRSLPSSSADFEFRRCIIPPQRYSGRLAHATVASPVSAGRSAYRVPQTPGNSGLFR
jgi:hypothetical protein